MSNRRDRRESAPSPECVAEVPSTAEAHVIAGFLQSNDINAQVIGIDWGGAHPLGRPSIGVRVLVPGDQAADARRLLADAEEDRE